ncbi:MAG: transcription termination factor NusA [Candidatus Hydrogenedentes bacterium]|nr:transcription termination factor NusA [Candidatus Hydrogenedentota bacterium]
METNLRVILQQLEAEKSIDRETLLEAIRSAIESAARKGVVHATNVTVDVDPDTVTFKVYEIREVVEKVTDAALQISLDVAIQLNPEVVVGNRLKVPAEPKDFGRIAAQTAKQVIIQKIKDAERENVFEEFRKRKGELITGMVKRVSHGNVFVGIGKAEAVLPHREQSPRENFKPGDRIRAYLLEVEKGPRGAQVVLSRTSPELVRALFELEVPEIYDGTIEIKGIAREPGSRTKVAVLSKDANVDAVGACVGMKGSRVRAVVEELSGEKIDIVRWSEDPVEVCTNALNPADIIGMKVDADTKSILVIVPHDQLSLAIGKRGQNARLASKLIGWNIDIRSDQEGQPPSGGAAGEESQPASSGAAGEESPVESGPDEMAESRTAPAGEKQPEPGETAEPFGENTMKE